MRGHEPIYTMRKNGQKPAMIFINDWPCKTDWFETGEHVTVCVDGDSIRTLDLRFVIGCSVSISSESKTRAKALLERCKTEGADVVAACAIDTTKAYHDQCEFAEIWRKK
jgi:hypothetical protein